MKQEVSTYRVVVHSATGMITAVSNATRLQALASIRMFMRADGYPMVDLIDEETRSIVKRYENKNFEVQA